VKHKTENVNLAGSEFIKTNLGEATFNDVRLAGARFIDINLSGALFENVNLTRVVIRNANCSHLAVEDACYEGMLIDGIPVTELLRVYRGTFPAPRRASRGRGNRPAISGLFWYDWSAPSRHLGPLLL
jgi:hypothetical protein